MKQYRITCERHDVPRTTVIEFKAEDDMAARLKFAEYKGKESYSWDYLVLFEVEQVERTRIVETRGD